MTVGTKALTSEAVLCFVDLSAKVTRHSRVMERMEARTLRSTSAEILSRALDGYFRSSAAAGSRLRGLTGLEPSIVRLSNCTGAQPQLILALADRVTGRHFPAQSSTLEHLEGQVQACLASIDDLPGLERLCPDECWVLKHFAHIRTAFQPNLGT